MATTMRPLADLPWRPYQAPDEPLRERDVVRIATDDVRLQAVPDDVRATKATSQAVASLCAVVVDMDAGRGQALAQTIPDDEAAVHCTDADGLDEVLQLIAPDVVVLSARDVAEALTILPTVRAHLAGQTCTIPLVCCLWHTGELSLRPLLYSAGADVVLVPDTGRFHLLESIQSTIGLMTRMREVATLEALQAAIDLMSDAAIVYDRQWRPVAANCIAYRLVHTGCGNRRDARLDGLTELFQGAARDAVTHMLTLFDERRDTTALQLRTTLGLTARSTVPVELRLSRLQTTGSQALTLVAFRDERDAVERTRSDHQAVTGAGNGEYLRSLHAITETLVRTFEFRTRDGADQFPGGVNEGGLLREAQALVLLLEGLYQDLAEEQERMLPLDTIVEQHTALFAKALVREHAVTYEPPPVPIIALAKPSAIRRALSLMFEAANPQEARGGGLQVSLSATDRQATVSVHFAPCALQLGLQLESAAESPGRADLLRDEISRCLAPFHGWVSMHTAETGALTVRMHLPAAY